MLAHGARARPRQLRAEDGMSAHTPGPWSQGRTLRTSQTMRWNAEQFKANDAIEEKMVFAYFSQNDQGRSRVLVASCDDTANACLVAAAPLLLDELLNIVNIDMAKMREDFGPDAEHQFRLWAQNRARAAIAKATPA